MMKQELVFTNVSGIVGVPVEDPTKRDQKVSRTTAGLPIPVITGKA